MYYLIIHVVRVLKIFIYRYHLDSDHSSQHDERPEEITRRTINRTYRQFFVQSSAETTTTTTTSDSLNADMEVCGILQTAVDINYDSDHQESVKCSPTPPQSESISTQVTKVPMEQEFIKKYSNNPFASLKAKLCSAHLPKTGYLTKMAVNKSIGLLSEPKKEKLFCNVSGDNRRNSDHAIQKKKSNSSSGSSGGGGCIGKTQSSRKPLGSSNKRENNFSKSTSFLLDSHKFKSSMGSNLRIKICKSPLMSAAAAAAVAAASSSSKPLRQLETDSSNEYESETGIPKSPTLFISGVSISRTPEPKSPGAALVNAATGANGRQSRSSSLSVPVCTASGTTNQQQAQLSSSNVNLNNVNCTVQVTSSITSTTSEPYTPSLVRSTTPASPKPSPQKDSSAASKAKSASEPEREREMFRFPKSSTDGALSSVLHVQESNLSSDDFHEALFLLERSPKTRDSKRRKKSKKKDKDHSDRMKEEASSAL